MMLKPSSGAYRVLNCSALYAADDELGALAQTLQSAAAGAAAAAAAAPAAPCAAMPSCERCAEREQCGWCTGGGAQPGRCLQATAMAQAECGAPFLQGDSAQCEAATAGLVAQAR